MMKKLAVVDVGSSSMRAFFAQITKVGDKYRVTKEKIARCPIRLGWDVLQTGKVSKTKQQLLIEQLKSYAEQLTSFKPDKFIALSTAAMRSASNAEQVLDNVFTATGIRLQIIDGYTEGMLLGCAVMYSDHDINQPFVCIDIGGGSTEVVICNQQRIEHISSIPIGTMGLLSQEHYNLQAFSTAIDQLKDKLPPQYLTVGLGGNINTAKKLCNGVEQSMIEVDELVKLYGSLRGMTRTQSIKNFGISQHRSEVLPLALDIFNLLCDALGCTRVYVPTLGLVDGAAICLNNPAIFEKVSSPAAFKVWQNLIK